MGSQQVGHRFVNQLRKGRKKPNSQESTIEYRQIDRITVKSFEWLETDERDDIHTGEKKPPIGEWNENGACRTVVTQLASKRLKCVC